MIVEADEVSEAVEQDIRGWDGLRPRDRRALTELVIANLSPNLTLNTRESIALEDAAAEADQTTETENQ